jgi:hypothetical protein
MVRQGRTCTVEVWLHLRVRRLHVHSQAPLCTQHTMPLARCPPCACTVFCGRGARGRSLGLAKICVGGLPHASTKKTSEPCARDSHKDSAQGAARLSPPSQRHLGVVGVEETLNPPWSGGA